jgi:hypothetical protein
MNTIAICLSIWIAVGGYLLWSVKRARDHTTGLSFAYFLGLALIHVPGAALYLDPRWDYYYFELVEVGFEIATVGVVGFAVGVFVGGLFLRRMSRKRVNEMKQAITQSSWNELNQLAWIFFAAGLIIQLLVQPMLGRLPLTAVISALGKLSIAGACLGLYAAYRSGNSERIRQWLVVALAFPVITTVASAFIGYGVYALLSVVAFVVAFSRIRARHLLLVLPAIYLGLSIYVTYMRDRTEYRTAVWLDEVSLMSRLDRLADTFLDFGWFNPNDDKHREAIDLRLNQNELVGAAEERIATGQVPKLQGETFALALIAPIPRLLWPDKPVVAGSGDVVGDITGRTYTDETSVGVGQVLEFFINFGWTGELLCFIAFGIICRLLDHHAATSLAQSDFQRFLLFFLPGQGLLQQGGMVSEIVGSAVAAIVAAWLASLLASRYIERLRQREHMRRQRQAASGS